MLNIIKVAIAIIFHIHGKCLFYQMGNFLSTYIIMNKINQLIKVFAIKNPEMIAHVNILDYDSLLLVFYGPYYECILH